jgi:hypothetical protein
MLYILTCSSVVVNLPRKGDSYNKQFDMYIWTTIRCRGVVAYSSYDSIPLLSGDRYFPVPVPLYIRGTSALIAKCSF